MTARPRAARPAKYRNRATVVDGIRFASAAEARRYGELKLLERAGMIYRLQLQPRYDLTSHGSIIGHYVADFSYDEPVINDPSLKIRRVAEDVKGVQTELFRWKAKHFRAQYPYIELRIIA